jgi:streptogramin lyase
VSVDPGPGQHPQGILWHGTSLYLSDLARNGIFRVNVRTGLQKAVAVGAPLISPREIAADGRGGLLTSDASARAVFRIDLRTGAVRTVSTGGSFVAPFGIALVPDCPGARRRAR